MNKRDFRLLMEEQERRVEQEGKRSPSWLMGYLQGKGKKKLTGYQIAALIDLLLVPLEKEFAVDAVAVPEKKSEVPEEKPEVNSKPEANASNNLLKTLAQR